jgi:ABC-type transporter Mla maintaining outer membrane lipid asymmetry permease subunit MlaE
MLCLADGPCMLQGGPWGSVFYEGVSHHAGFNEWAEANDIVIIYPVIKEGGWGVTGQAHGCWDGYAQTGTDYGLKSGAQISVVRNLISAVAGV